MLKGLSYLNRKLEKCVQIKQKKTISVHMADGKYLNVEIVHKKGIDLIHEPLHYKGMAHPYSERDRLNLRGLIPPITKSLEVQQRDIMQEYRTGVGERAATEIDEDISKSGITKDDIRKWRTLQSLQDRNETLFYKIVKDNFQEMNRIIYTPTVGWACSLFSQVYRRPRGMFFSSLDKGQMASMVYNWPHEDVEAIVMTDGSRVLGLGDLGIGGLGISIGKLDLYVAGGGFHPRKVLPIVLDVGTDNPKLLAQPDYIGLRQNRIDGEQYYQLLDELIAACYLRWPKVLIQFEDFQLKHAIKSLRRYRQHYLCFNDDIQGTAATVLAGLFGALAVKGDQPKNIINQKILICGAGSAGGGAITQISKCMRHSFGLSAQKAGQNFWVHDQNGLITLARKNLTELETNFNSLRLFARNELEYEGEELIDTIKRVRPHILIGLSGVGGLFTPEILQEMTQQQDDPIIFALSNPTSRSECSAEQAIQHTQGRAIFCSGSPYEDVIYNSNVYSTSQCNNKYIFPGLALGASLGQTGTISDGMLMCAAESLSELLQIKDIQQRKCFPEQIDIREISSFMASKVIQQAYKEGKVIQNQDTYNALMKGFKELHQYVQAKQWQPEYRPIVHLNYGQK